MDCVLPDTALSVLLALSLGGRRASQGCYPIPLAFSLSMSRACTFWAGWGMSAGCVLIQMSVLGGLLPSWSPPLSKSHGTSVPSSVSPLSQEWISDTDSRSEGKRLEALSLLKPHLLYLTGDLVGHLINTFHMIA